MRGSARIHDVRMAQFVLKIEKLSHIMGPRASQDLRSPSPIMAPVKDYLTFLAGDLRHSRSVSRSVRPLFYFRITFRFDQLV